MSSTYRSIIVESCSRANIVPRKRAVPSDVFESANNLLKGVLEEYSNRNFITAYSNEVNFVPQNESFLVGEGPDVIVEANKIQTPKAILYKLTDNDWVPMNFIAYDQFYSAGYGNYAVSWQPTGKNQYKLYFKPIFVSQGRTCKLIYTCEMSYNDNDVINLPAPYIELLTRALAYKLSVALPRTDITKQQSLLKELTDLENMLQAANASKSIITRDSGNMGSLMSNFLGGSFITGI